MKKLTKKEVEFLKSNYEFFIEDSRDMFNSGMYDYKELRYQMNHLDKLNLDNYKDHARYGFYVGEVLKYCSRMNICFDCNLGDELLNKFRETMIKSLENIPNEEFYKCIDNSPAEKKKKEFQKKFGGFFPMF